MRHVFLTSVLFLAAIEVSAQPSFILVDLGISGVSSVGRINDQGQVVGSYRPGGAGSPIEHAFIWLPRPAGGLSAGLNDLGVLGGATSSSFGRDLNEAGQVVGLSETGREVFGFPEQIGFSWQTGEMQPLRPGTQGYFFSSAAAVNEFGEVVGAEGAGFGCHPLLWLPAPAYGLPAGTHILPPLPGGSSEGAANDVNGLGQVVGAIYFACDALGKDHAVLWLPAPAYGLPAGAHDLTAHLGDVEFASADAINDRGQIVGFVGLAEEPGFEPFLWQDNVLVLLGTLPGETFASASDLNDAGQIVGRSGFSAFLWENGTMSDLNDLISPRPEWQLRWASGINNRGQIVGMALVEGAFRAFRLDPAATVFYDGFESGDVSAW